MSVASHKCSARKRNGAACTNWALRGKKRCWVHAEDNSEERRRACRKGAQVANAVRGAKLARDIPEDLTSISALVKTVEFVLREAIAERLDPKVATVAATLVRVQAGLIVDHDLESRILALESAVETQHAEVSTAAS